MITKYINEAPKEASAEIKKMFVEMLNHNNFHFEWDYNNTRFVAISAEDAWDTNPNSEIAEIVIKEEEEETLPDCNYCGGNHYYNECGWRD